MPLKMHQNIRSTLIPFGLKALCAAVASALVCFSSANAAGLGKLTVLSSLGQPLRAEIELTSVAKDEAGSLVAKLASTEVFRQANIEFNPALLSLHFTIDRRSEHQYIRVTSSQAINEPFVDMLLELGSANGRLVREYTFLLDPAEMRAAQPAQVAAPINVPTAVVPQTAPAQASRQQEQVPPLPAARSVSRAPSAKQEAKPKQDRNQSDYQVKKGDTLAGIANRVKPEGISLDQMLVGLYHANPDAFSGKNMNRLRTGQILLVPTAEAAQGISKNEAKNIVLAQAADFNSYRNRLAGMVANASPNKSTEARQSAGGKISAKVEERATAANEAKDKLKLSKAANASAPEKTLGAATSAEDKIAKDKATADANARVKELEKNVSDLQKILEIKSKDMAVAQQKQVETPAAVKPAVPASATASSVASNLKAVNKPQSAVAPVAISATATAASTPSAKATIPPKPVAKPVIKHKPVVPVRPEPSLLDELMENSALLAAAGAIIAGLGGLGLYYSRRKKKNGLAKGRVADDASLKANSLFGSTGGQSVDTNNSVFNSNFAPSASQLDTNEVDPVAEADVYIAYGRDAQAEEILKEALRTQPERNAVRLKLLEIYAARKDIRLFDMQASELYAMTRGEGEEWALAATMGLAIDPNNPLYAGGELPDEMSAKAAPLHSLTQPLEDLDPEALLGNLPQHESLDSTELKLDDAELKIAPANQPAELGMEFDIGQVASQVTANGLDFDLSEPPAETITTFPNVATEAASLADLDFDLGTSATVKKDGAPALSSTAIAEAAPSLNEPSFDLGIPVSGKAGATDANHAGEAVETIIAGTVAETTEKSPEFAGLDFDLRDFGSAEVKPEDTLPVQTPAQNAAFDDFDFDLGDPVPDSNQNPATDPVESSITLKEESSIDFDDLASFQPAKIDSAGVPNMVARLDPEIELDGIDSFEQPALELPNINVGHEATETIEVPLPESAPVAFDVDLSAISLDLTSAERSEESPKPTDTAVFDTEIVIPSGNPEMETKLDLAAAYQEIGDKEGARELLDEVISGGSAMQIKTAREMRSKLV
jgi:pilus assembly protein FimV